MIDLDKLEQDAQWSKDGGAILVSSVSPDDILALVRAVRAAVNIWDRTRAVSMQDDYNALYAALAPFRPDGDA